MPKISVIVPIYKIEPYLGHCVDSILDQTFTDFELILVDDGSSDGCSAICDAYVEKDSRVIVIHKENGGLSSARNAGLDVATGEYIYFVDGDDWVAGNLFETVLPYLDKYDMVRFSFYIVTDNVAEKIKYSVAGKYSLCNDNDRVGFTIQKLLTRSFMWTAWAGLYNRHIIAEFNLRFADDKIIFAEDLYFTLCYCVHVNNAIILDNCLYYYYQRADSIMNVQTHILNAGRMNELSKAVLEHFIENKMEKVYFEAFPVMYYMILNGVIDRYKNETRCSVTEIRNKLLDDIKDFDYFKNWILGLRKFKKWLVTVYSIRIKMEYELSCMEYYATGQENILLKIKCLEPFVKCMTKVGHLLKFLKLR